MSAMENCRRPQLRPFVRLQTDKLSQEHMLLYPEGAMKLNASAHAIVLLCNGQNTCEQIVDELSRSFEASREEISRGVELALQQLLTRNLLEFMGENRVSGTRTMASLFFVLALSLCGCGANSKPVVRASVESVSDNEPAAIETSYTPSESSDEDNEWRMAAKDHANTRFSRLNEINASNVKNLKEAWTFHTGVEKGQEAAPLVIGSTMYIVTPYPNILYALDLNKPGTVKWKYEPKPMAAAQGEACCDVVNRGAVFDDGKLFYNTLDCHTVCVDAESGKEVWKTKLGDINKGETMTMSPIVVKGKVLVGNSGGEFGVRGWLTALNAKDGSIAWRAYNTGPDSDCLINENFKPHYDMDRGKDLGVKTWPPDHWKIGGGTVWGWVSYDPELDLVYYGTGNPGPWNSDARPGDNKWTSGVFARKPDNGEAQWFYQWSPHDLFDHDGINECIVIDLDIDGQTRKVLLHAGRTGYVYVLNRESGEVLSATPFVRITSSLGVDLKSGRLIPNAAKQPQLNKVVRDIAPLAAGAKDWQPCAWSPMTKLLYIPATNMSMDWEETEANYIAGTPYIGNNTKMYAGPGGNRGEFIAWDPIKKEKIWSIKENFPCWSGVLATAGDVVFYGTMEGYFKAIHARTGKLLWQNKTSSGIIGQPMTFRGPDGKQYVAILSGVGGWAGAVVSADLDTRDASAALGFVGAMKDLPQHTKKGGTLYVYALP